MRRTLIATLFSLMLILTLGCANQIIKTDNGDGFPLEMVIELALEKGIKVNEEIFKQEFDKHRSLSQTASKGMFKGGVASQSETITKYHTATHLLRAALRQILGKQVEQKDSNITEERLRFDFSYPEKMKPDQIKAAENLVNEKIKEDLTVKKVYILVS
jgi:alanyl-tRNA synthetase